MKGMLRWEVTSEGVLFSAHGDDGKPHPWKEWARLELRDTTGRRVHVGPVLRRVEEGLADVVNPLCIRLPHTALAGFESIELGASGLPRRLPFSIDIRSEGAIPDPSFRFKWGFVRDDGSPLVGVQRTGSFLRSGSESYIIPDPLYPLIDAMEDFNRVPPRELEGRFLAWAKIKEFVPNEARVDDYLRNMRVATATSFTLRPFVNDSGEPDLDPVVGHGIQGESGDYEEVTTIGHRESLPPARQSDFARQFRSRGSVLNRYAVGSGWYLVLPEQVRKALEVVHQAQRGSPDARRRFLERPHAFLKQALAEVVSDDVVENLLWDEGLSDRVREIGAWTPKVLPWLLKSSGQEWLPPEEVGLRVGDQLVHLEKKDIPELVEKVREGIKIGSKQVDQDGQSIPCSMEALESLERLEREIRAPKEPGATPTPTSGQPIALLIKDNLENLDYEREPRVAAPDYDRSVPSLRAKLLPHQQAGLEWLQDRWASGTLGGLLSDDMGLGKTLQALAFLAWLRTRAEPRRPFLVIAPTGLLKNWRDEHDLHFDRSVLANLVPAYGNALRSIRSTKGLKELNAGFPVLDVRQMEKSDWVLASYETVRDYQHSFGRLHWGAIVLDEAQKIKNPAAALSDAAKALYSDFVVALTGTPVENRMADLWSIVDAVSPGRLGALKDFVKQYEDQQTDDNKELRELRTELMEGENPPLMKRRLKEEHLEGLPQKDAHFRRKAMPAKQAAVYSDAVQRGRMRQADPGGMLEALHALREISLHPGLQEDFADDNEFISGSGRLIICFEVLDDIYQKGEKALIFTESRVMQGILSEILQRRYALDAPPLLINGAVSGEKRKSKVDDFQSRHGFDVMLLSPRAGGVGLTLTAANHVIHLSRWWNPAVEDQCTDRVYRIGQRRRVHAYYPIAVHPEYDVGSFDVRLDDLLARKRAVSHAVLAPTSFSENDTAQLFRDTIERPAK